MKNSVELELEQLLGTIKLELGGGFPKIETKKLLFFGSFFWEFLKFKSSPAGNSN
jgi:hypothetical protein